MDSTPLYGTQTGNKVRVHLLWGDGVQVLQQGPARTKVRARGRKRIGWVKNSALGGKPLLELYFIDVGQGDGILIKTPKSRHLMIDGGYPRGQQDTGKNAADFVDWKFYEDYAENQIRLDAVIASHCDADHYGGLWDLLNVANIAELDAKDVRVKSFYHSGIGWWKGNGKKTLGTPVQHGDDRFFTQLMGDRMAVQAALGGGPGPQLHGWWADFIQAVLGTRWTDNQPTSIERLSSASGYVPGFEPGNPDEPSIKVLAPVHFDVDGSPAVRMFAGGDDKNTNGNSLLLRLDYGRVRVLLTGDLNRESQRALLSDYTGRRQEFECDVAKACHHGSDKVSYEFLQAMRPAVTIISSGDNEGHDHPRPAIVAASAVAGYPEIADDELISPLVYSTELARSLSPGRPFKLVKKDADGQSGCELAGEELEEVTVHFEVQKPGDIGPQKKQRRLANTLIVGGLIYGLVNVRTDGDRVLCAVLNEKDYTWQIRTLRSRF